MDKNYKVVPLNDIPNDILEKMDDTKEKINQTNKIMENKIEIEKEISFVWGFLFFDIPNITVNGNKIYFTGEIHRDSVHQIKEKIMEVSDKLNRIYFETGEQLPIYLFLNSPGGSVHSGFDLIDFIENYHFPIITVGTGCVASMGFMILLSGKEKYLTPNAHILIHQISTMIGGKRKDILDYVKHLEDLHKQFIKYITKRTKLQSKEVEELLSKESWLSAEESLNMGIIDGIFKK